MPNLFKISALIGLALTILPPVLLFMGMIDSLDTTKTVMLIGMIVWYAGATPWLGLEKLEPTDLEVEI